MATPLPVLALSLATLSLGAACSKSETPAQAEAPSSTPPAPAVTPTPEPSSMNTDNLQLTWSASPSGTTLSVSYTVENKGSTPVFVASKLLEGGAEVDRLVVMNGPDAIRLVRGLVMPDGARVLTVPLPIFTQLAAGQSLDATIDLPLPLVGWHNAGPVTPLRPAKHIMLEVAVAESEKGPPKWLVGAPLPAP